MLLTKREVASKGCQPGMVLRSSEDRKVEGGSVEPSFVKRPATVALRGR